MNSVLKNFQHVLLVLLGTAVLLAVVGQLGNDYYLRIAEGLARIVPRSPVPRSPRPRSPARAPTRARRHPSRPATNSPQG